LLAGAATPTLHAAIVLLGTLLPFARAAQLLERLQGVRISASTVRRYTEAAGVALGEVEAAFVDQIERELPEAPAGPRHQLVSVDGAMVPVVGGEWREAKTAVIGAIRVRADGTISTDQLSYCSRMSDVETFSRAVTGECHRRGTERAAVVAAVADGAPWCQQVFDDQVPLSIRILDFPHAVGHLAEAAQAVFGHTTAATTDWLAVQRRRLRDDDPDLVLTALAELPVERAADPAAATLTRDRVLAYFTTRRAQITYVEFRARGLPIGSGAVESANKHVVEARLKGAGMHWRPDNVNPMLALRAALCSERWDAAWNEVARHLTTKARPTAPAPDPQPSPVNAPPLPSSRPPVQPKSARTKTVVDGKPTAQHPYRRASTGRFKYLEMCGAKK
jgi:hypothetical protein